MMYRCALFLLFLISIFNCWGCNDSADGPALSSAKQAEKKESIRKANAKWSERLVDQAKYDEAIEEASQVLLTEPKNALAILSIGRSLAAKGNHVAALEALKSIPEEDILYGYRARELMIDWAIKLGPWDDAEKWIRDLLKSRPNDYKLRLQLAGLMNICGRRYEACRELEEVFVDHQADPHLLLLMLDPTEPIDTRKWAESVLTRFPDDSLAKLELATYAMFMQDYDLAIEQYKSVLAAKNIPDAYANLALAYAREERWNDLVALLKKAPPETATFPGIWIAIGAMYESQKDYSQAATAYLMTLDTCNAQPEALRGLARALTENGQDAAARVAANQIAHCTSIGDQLKRLSRDTKDHETILVLADDLQFFGRGREALAWLIYSWENGGGNPALTQAIQKLKNQLASDTQKPNQFTSATRYWAKQIEELAKIDSIEPPKIVASYDSSSSSIRFQDMAEEVGVKFMHDMGPLRNQGINIYQTNGTGVGAIDYDLDGWVDLYLPQAAGMPLEPSPDRINFFYRNIDGAAARDVHRQTGIDIDAWGQGVAVGDIDGDGIADLYIACYGESSLWKNCGDGTFCKLELPLTPNDKESMSTSVAIADINGDGLPDIIEANYSDLRTVMSKVCYSVEPVEKVCSPIEFASADDRIYLNNGDGSFLSGNDKWDLRIEGGRGYGIVVGNFDRRHGNDVYIANDMNANHYLASRDDDSDKSAPYRLFDESALSGLSVDSQGRSQASMGIAVGDLNRDHLVDMFVTNFYDEFNVVYTGVRGGVFNDSTAKHRLSNSNKKTLGFGTQAIDFNRDGYLDLAILNGHVDDFSFQGIPFKMPAELYAGSASGFSLVPNKIMGAYFEKLTLGRALATLDWNRDLRIDLVANHLDHPLALLRNETTTDGHAIQFELVGTKCDRDATGAYIEVHAGNEHWTTCVVRGSGYECSNEALVDVGIGKHTAIDKVIVTWPDHQSQEFKNLNVDNRYLLVEGQHDAWPRELVMN